MSLVTNRNNIFKKGVVGNVRKAQEDSHDMALDTPNGDVFVVCDGMGGHVGGAARMAYEHFGAVWGKGVGMYGKTYAIPTMQGGVETIKPYVDDFLQFATVHGELDFLVTEIGCGIAGFTPQEIAPLFFKAIENDIKNVYLPGSFYRVLEQ